MTGSVGGPIKAVKCLAVSPRESEYPDSKVIGPKIHALNGFWALKPYTIWVLGPLGFGDV